jgi:hypothetical protein
MPRTVSDPEGLIKALVEAGVEFIVVGGVCAVLHGAPFPTFDLDIVYSRDPANLARLEHVLREYQARYRLKPEVSPDARRLDTPGHHLLATSFGPLDMLGSIENGQGYQDLIVHSEEISFDPRTTFRILDLPTLIAIKQSLGRDQDLRILPILKRTLAEKEKK